MPTQGYWPTKNHAGGHHVVDFAPLLAAETFEAGALVFTAATGELEEFPADGTVALVADLAGGGTSDLYGISAIAGDTALGLDGPQAGDSTTFYPAAEGTQFWTPRVRADLAGAVGIPPGSMVGSTFQLFYDDNGPLDNQGWAILTIAAVTATDIRAEVKQVLNRQREPIAAADTTTGVWVVFELRDESVAI